MKITIKHSPKQYEAWQKLIDKETSYIGFGGGAGGGKTWLGCEWILLNALLYPETRWFIGREELKRLKDSTLQTFYKVCAFHKIKQEKYKYNGQDNFILFDNGSRVDLLDLKLLPSDPLYERYGSVEFTGGWIEEAGEVNFNAFDTLKSRIGRQMNDKYKLHPKIFLTFNPKKNWLYHMFWKPFRDFRDGKIDETPKEAAFIQSLVDDNPYNETSYKQQLLQIRDKVQKERLLYGNWDYDDDPAALMDHDAISDLFSNVVELGERALTVDVARLGKDKTVFMLWEGWRCIRTYVYRKQDTEITKQKIRELSINERIPYSKIVIDEDGVGGGVVDGLRGVKGFVGNSSPMPSKSKPDEKPNYRNLRSQCYYYLADAVNTRKISVTPEVISDEPTDLVTMLSEELALVRAKYVDDDNKKLQVAPKEEAKEYLGRSPDFADALMMRMYLEVNPTGQDDPAAIARINFNRQQKFKKYLFF